MSVRLQDVVMCHNLPPCPLPASSRGPIECDFEDGTLCGWSADPDDDIGWIVHRHSTPTEGTGPLYDHTFGKEGNGK